MAAVAAAPELLVVIPQTDVWVMAVLAYQIQLQALLPTTQAEAEGVALQQEVITHPMVAVQGVMAVVVTAAHQAMVETLQAITVQQTSAVAEVAVKVVPHNITAVMAALAS